MEEQLRRIKRNDLELLFNWRNHPSIRRTSFDKGELSLADHKEWFGAIFKSTWVLTYIFEIDNNPVGVIRFDMKGRETAKINYLIDPSQQGKGYGTRILNLGMERVLKDNLELKKVYGYVLKENLPSIRIFQKLSFEKVSENTAELKFEKSRE